MTKAFREKLYTMKPILGTWHTLASPLVTEALASAGLDFILIDLEHGPFLTRDFHSFVDKCKIHGAAPIARLPNNEEWLILQVLDQGASGILVSHLETPDQARAIYKAAHFSPKGHRSYSPFTKAGDFGGKSASQLLGDTSHLVLGGIIESKKGLENLEQILKENALDIIYFGAYDLSTELGCPGDFQSEKLLAPIRKALSLVNHYGKISGGFVPKTIEEIQTLYKLGMSFFTYQVDSNVLRTHYSEIANNARCLI